LVAGGVEVTKDAVILGAVVAGGESMGFGVAGAAGGAVVGTIVVDGVI
jgi:hypothetical protein